MQFRMISLAAMIWVPPIGSRTTLRMAGHFLDVA